ncbi:MAG TPA: AMP-binding protein [Microthrixaceae bacterium]|nr:AMP-binding protein [Microthrixaceae bacterium]
MSDLADFSLADAWETIADVVGDAPALYHQDIVRTWAEFEERSARLASVLLAHGVGHDSKVAHYLYNGPEYLEATFASFKARAVPVNVNYRYTDAELSYLLDNSDAEAIVVDTTFAEHVERLLPSLPKVKLVVEVGGSDGSEDRGRVAWVGYEEAIAAAEPAPRIARSGDDLWFLYTGGTTGMPKGVMWPHRSLFGTGAATFKNFKLPLPATLGELADSIRTIHAEHETIRLLPAAPLMHGTSAIASWGVMCAGGAINTLASRSFDPAELLEAVQRNRVTNLTIVGDAFAKPIIAELERAESAGSPYELSSLRLVISSGVMWSQQTKDALLARADVLCADLLGSSEGVGFANSVAKRNRPAPTARFRLGEHAQVFTEEGVAVEPGSGERGLLAVGGPIPIGYYKDPEKSAGTFRPFGGRVWSVPGDWATVDADGTITLLGRGSVCINTAGEKVFPEEVEETLKTHAAVRDANVVGVPDDKWGQAVVAVVSFEPGASAATADLVAHCRETLAGYKVPKRFEVVDVVRRGPNGKADYRWAASVASGA